MTGRSRVPSRRWLRLRLGLVGVVFGLGLLVLVAQAVNLQILRHRELAAKAQRQFLRQVEIAPRRGVIYDRNQEELALSLEVPSVFASPLKITNPRRVGRQLARVLGLDPRRVIARLRSEKGFVWVARRVNPDKAAALRRLQLPGVGLIKETRRYYPNLTLASHLLGFAGLDARGLEGLERRYDRILRGQPHRVTLARDALGRKIHLSPVGFEGQLQGRNLILTIDKGLQYQVEKILAQTVSRYRAKGGQVVVMVPRTGEILALASLPNFNPNVFFRYPRQNYRNRAITDTFEPGSTFKMFVAAAALRSRRVSLETRFDCEKGQWKLGDRVIHDAHHFDRLNLADIIKFSSNIGAAKVGQVVGAEELYRTFRDFGFGSPTGVDLPGESRGILRPPRRWRPVDLANICFGQGVAVTPLQLTAAVAAIANGGLLMRPYVVLAEMDGRAHLVRETQPRVLRRVLGVREARILGRMLERVTEPGGTGTRARVEGIAVAGKTGTAQKVKPGGGYSQRDFIASFVGFAPADDPQVAVLVVIDTPRGGHYGGQVAAPAFARIVRAALDSLGYSPPNRPDLLMVRGKSPAPQLPPASPDAPARAAAGNRSRAGRELAAGRTPDLAGLSLRQVLEMLGPHRVQIKARGWGRVVAQNPRPGSPFQGSLSLRLAPPGGGAS